MRIRKSSNQTWSVRRLFDPSGITCCLRLHFVALAHMPVWFSIKYVPGSASVVAPPLHSQVTWAGTKRAHEMLQTTVSSSPSMDRTPWPALSVTFVSRHLFCLQLFYNDCFIMKVEMFLSWTAERCVRQTCRNISNVKPSWAFTTCWKSSFRCLWASAWDLPEMKNDIHVDEI